MLCPNCGKSSKLDQKFCRACGMNLAPVSKALAEHLSADVSRESAKERDRRIARRLLQRMGLGGIVLFIGFFSYAISRRLLHNDLAELGSGLILLAGTFLMMWAIFSALWTGLNAGGEGGSIERIESRPAAITTPTGLAEAPASVTEQTTKIMAPDRQD